MFRQTYLPLCDAFALVKERTGNLGGRTNQLHLALIAGELSVFLRKAGSWEDQPQGWYEAADIWWPSGLTYSRPHEGQFSATNDIYVRAEAIERLWPGEKVKSSGGRTEKYDWKRALLHAARRAYDVDVELEKLNQAEVMRMLADYLADTPAGEPGRTLLQEHADLFLEMMRPKKGR